MSLTELDRARLEKDMADILASAKRGFADAFEALTSAARKEAYQQGWNDREADFLIGMERISPAREQSRQPQEGAGQGEAVAWTGRTHDLKTWPTPFDAVASGLKTWELRLNDRDYQVGDRLRLRRWVPVAESYSGEETTRQVMWMLKGPAFGLPEGYVIMSLSPPDHPSQAELDRLRDRVAALEPFFNELLAEWGDPSFRHPDLFVETPPGLEGPVTYGQFAKAIAALAALNSQPGEAG